MEAITVMVGRILLISSLSIILAVLMSSITFAATCEDFEVIYIRGSGQKVNAEQNQEGYQKERESLKTSLSKLISRSYKFTELDQITLGLKGSYDAVKVSDESILTGLNAFINAGKIGIYAKSVDGGVALLKEYLLSRLQASPSTCYILTGYSQGAHVVGEFIAQNENQSQLIENIKYVGLMGDPKLDLDGIDVIPGKNVPWYRGDAIPLIQGGMLGNRKPYMPNADGKLKVPSGSWCLNIDVVCSSNFIAAKTTGHFEYPEVAVPQMALEIANIINNPTGIIDKNKRPSDTCGSPKQDVVVLLDTSPLMRRDAKIFTDTPMYYGANPPAKLPTAGEMLIRSGCGDTRVAVVGYGRKSDGPPSLLLDFTNDPKAYDALLKSLYNPALSGTYERTQLREAALKASSLVWRVDASRVLFAITDIAGSGPVGPDGWRNWDDSRVSEPYLKDTVSQTFLNTLREKDIVLTGIPVTHTYSGFQKGDTTDIAVATDIIRYMRMMSLITGGYQWVKQVPSYNGYDFKYSLLDQTINYTMQAREKTIGSVRSIRGKVGQPLQLSMQDTLSQFAAASLRNDSISYSWYVDCSNRGKVLYDFRQSVTFTPSQSGKCFGTVIARVGVGSGAGCYSCPEPFPPYMYRSFPFIIDIKPVDYVAKIPASIVNVSKIITDDSVAYSWHKPAYNGESEIVYVVRDADGVVLALTTEEKLTIINTNKTDPDISIGSAGEDGQSVPLSSSQVTSIDARTPDREETVVVTEPVDILPTLPTSENNEAGMAVPAVASIASVSMADNDESRLAENMTMDPEPLAVRPEQVLGATNTDRLANNSSPNLSLRPDSTKPKPHQGGEGRVSHWLWDISLLVATIGCLVAIFIKKKRNTHI